MDEFEHLSDAELEKIANPPAAAAKPETASPTDEFSHLSDAELEKIANPQSAAAPRPTGQQPFSASLVPNRQQLEAFGSRYLDVPTFGMATAARAGIGSLLHGTTYPEEYRRIKGIQQQAQEAYPKTSAAGTVGGLATSLAAPGALYAPAIGGSRVLGAGLTGGLSGGIETYGETGGKPGAGLSDVGMGALYGAGFGTTGQRLGEALPAIGQWFGRKAGVLQKPAAWAQQKANASALYNQAKQFGIWVRPDKVRTLVQDLNDRLANEAQFDPATHGDVARILKNLYGKVMPSMTGQQSFLPLEQLEAVTQNINKGLLRSNDRQKQSMGAIIKDEIRNVIDNLDHTDVIGANPQQAVDFLNQARPIWGRARRAQDIENALARARANAIHGSDPTDAIRAEIKGLHRQALKRPGTWSPQEMEAMEQIMSPSVVGGLAPKGKLGMAELVGFMTALGTGNYGTAAGIAGGALTGLAGQKLAQKMKKSAGERLMQDVGAGTLGVRPLATKAAGQLGQAEAADVTSPGIDYDENGRRIINVTRPARASGGRVSLDGCATRAHRDLCKELRPLMDQPDEAIAHALRLAK